MANVKHDSHATPPHKFPEDGEIRAMALQLTKKDAILYSNALQTFRSRIRAVEAKTGGRILCDDADATIDASLRLASLR